MANIKMFIRKCSIVLMVAVFAAQTSFADSEIIGDRTWSYNIVGDEATVNSVYPSDGDLTIPSVLGGKPVTRVEARLAWSYGYYHESLSRNATSVTIPTSVRSIGYKAFHYSQGLTSITIPSSVTNIDDFAFQYCEGLASVTISSNVQQIGASTFLGCNSVHDAVVPGWKCNIDFSEVTNLVIAEGTTTISNKAFSGCSKLMSVAIPSSVKKIENYAFESCSGLTTAPIPFGVASIGYMAFKDCVGLTSLTIPSSVTSIDQYAFDGCRSLISVKVPSSVTSMGWGVFYGCRAVKDLTAPGGVYYDLLSSVTNLIITEGTTRVWGGSCSGLMSVIMPPTVTNIDYEAFSGCSKLTSIAIPTNVMSIGNRAFSGCSGLSSVKIPTSVTSIGDYAFSNCSGLHSVEIPSSVTNIGIGVFSGCSGITDAVVPGILVGLPSVTNLVIAEGVTHIGDFAYSCYSRLMSMTIPSGVASIGECAFSNCYGLTSITIPSGVTNIGANAFAGCENIQRVDIPTIADWSGICFGSAEANPLHSGASLFVGGEEIISLRVPDEVTSIGAYAFQGGRFTSVTVPSAKTKVSETAFAGCSNITTVALNGGLTYQRPKKVNIQGWTMLEDGVFKAERSTAGSRTFMIKVEIAGPLNFSFKWQPTYSENILSFYVDDQQTQSLQYSSQLQTISVEIPAGSHELTWLYSTKYVNDQFTVTLDMTELWLKNWPVVEGLFSSSFTNITELTIADGSECVNPSFCEGCSALEKISIPSGVTNIGANAFAGCGKVQRVDFPCMEDWIDIKFENAESNPIHSGAAFFVNGNEVNALTIPDGKEELRDYVFYGGRFESVSLPISVTNVSATTFEKCANITAVVVGGALSSQSNKPKSVDAQSWKMTDNGVFNSCGSSSSLSQTLQIVVEGPLDFSFRWRARNNYGSTYFYIDDVKTYQIRGLWGSEWRNSSLNIPSGEHTLKWACDSGGCVDLTEWWKDRPVIEGLFPDSYTNITSVVIAEGTKFINSRFCEGCLKLTSVSIPDGVTNIGRYAFAECSELSSVIIPSSVTSIGMKAFSNCEKLDRINVYCLTDWLGIDFETADANPLTMGASLCVGDKEITELLIPQGTTEIGEHAFCGGGCFRSILMPNSITNVASTAFVACSNVFELTVPSWVNVSSMFADSKDKITRVSVSSRGDVPASAYQGCSSLARVDVISLSEWLSLHFPNREANPLHTGAKLFVNGKEELSWDIPDGISKLDNYSFLGGQFGALTIPNSVTNVAPTAFIGCSNINTVTLNGALSVLKPKVEEVRGWRMPEDGVFKVERSTGLNQASILRVTVNGPRSFSFRWKSTYSGNYMYYYVDGQQKQYLRYSASDWQSVSVEIPDGQHELKWVYSTDSNYGNYYGWVDFSEWWQKDMPIAELFPDSFTNITSVTIADGTEYVGSGFCEGCSALESVTIPSGIIRIGANAFVGCESLKQVNIPSVSDWVGIRYENPFSNPMRLGATLRVAGEEIANLIIPEGATELSNYAFLNGQFVSVSIPTSVTSVSSTAFSGCTTICKVTLSGSLSPAKPTMEEVQGWQMLDDGIFQISQTNEYLKASVLRIAVDGPRKFSFRWSYNLNERFFSIDGQGSYYSYQGFSSSDSWHDVSISIPEGSHELKWTFSTDDMYSGYYGNIDLTEWWRSNPSVIKSIFPDSFTNIASVTIIDGSEKVDPHFCEGCSSLTEISIPASITSVGECAFSGCSELQSVQIPLGVTNIGTMAFSDCDGLTSVIIPKEVISIDDCAFENCTNLKVLFISDGVTQIGSNAFRGCCGLEAVTIPSSVTSIGNDVFSGCNSIANATVPGRKCGIDFSAVTNLIVAEGTSSIDANAFEGCDMLRSVELPLSLTRVDRTAFSDCRNLISIQLPDTGFQNGQSMGYPGWSFNFSGDTKWSVDDVVYHSGTNSIRSGNPGVADTNMKKSTTLTATLCGNGIGSFWWKVDCEPKAYDIDEYYDYAIFSIDGVEIAKIAGITEWSQVEYEIAERGIHILSWTFVRDDYDEDESVYENTMWIDDLAFQEEPIIVEFDANGATDGDVPSKILGRMGDRILVPVQGNLKKGTMMLSGWFNDEAFYAPGAEFTIPFYGTTFVAEWTEYWTLDRILNAENMTFTTGGDSEWSSDFASTHDGVVSLRSGAITDSQRSWVQAEFVGKGKLSFWTKSAGEFYRGKMCDLLTVTLDGVEVFSGATNDWTNVVVSVVGDGSHTMKWIYSKNAARSSGGDCAWVDEISWLHNQISDDPIPEVDENATEQAVASALLGSADTRLVECITNVANYNAYREWATNVRSSVGEGKAGMQAVKDSPHAWFSFALDSDRLVKTLPTNGQMRVEKFEPTSTAGSFDFTVTIDDVDVGSEATKENLKKVFGLQGGATLDTMSSTNVDISFGTPENGRVKFTAGPNAKNADAKTFFMKVKMTP